MDKFGASNEDNAEAVVPATADHEPQLFVVHGVPPFKIAEL